MKETKTCRLLQLLDATEIRELQKSNLPENHNRLLAVLAGFHPDFDHKRLTREQVFKKALPGETFRDQRWRNLLTELNRSIENYLLCKMLRSHPDLRETLLALALAGRPGDQLFREQTENALSKLETQPARNRDFFLCKTLLHRALYFHPNTDRWNETPAQLLLFEAALDSFYHLEKLHSEAEKRNRTYIFSEKNQVQPLLENPLDSHPAAQLLRKILLLHDTDSDTVFREIRDQFHNAAERLSTADTRIALGHLRNFAVRRINAGEQNFNAELFDIYELELARNLLTTVNGWLPESVFINYCQTGAWLGHFERVESFIADYREKLHPENRSNVLALSFGNLCFQKALRNPANAEAELRKALQHLEAAGVRGERMFQLQAKMLDLKIWYEMFLADKTLKTMLLSKTKNFEVWLAEAGLSAEKMEAYHAFLRFVRQLTKANFEVRSATAKARQSLLENLAAAEQVNNRQWLSEKINQL